MTTEKDAEIVKILFKGKIKPQTTWVGTLNQKKTYRDKYGIVKKGESRCCYLNTKWGHLSLPNYKDIYKFANKTVIITIKILKQNKRKAEKV